MRTIAAVSRTLHSGKAVGRYCARGVSGCRIPRAQKQPQTTPLMAPGFCTCGGWFDNIKRTCSRQCPFPEGPGRRFRRLRYEAKREPGEGDNHRRYMSPWAAEDTKEAYQQMVRRYDFKCEAIRQGPLYQQRGDTDHARRREERGHADHAKCREEERRTRARSDRLALDKARRHQQLMLLFKGVARCGGVFRRSLAQLRLENAAPASAMKQATAVTAVAPGLPPGFRGAPLAQRSTASGSAATISPSPDTIEWTKNVLMVAARNAPTDAEANDALMAAARLECEAAAARDAMGQSEILDIIDERQTALAGTEELHDEDLDDDDLAQPSKFQRL